MRLSYPHPAVLGAALLLAGCGGESGPADPELEQEARERAAALEAVEKNILGADVPAQDGTNAAIASTVGDNIVANEAETPLQSDSGEAAEIDR